MRKLLAVVIALAAVGVIVWKTHRAAPHAAIAPNSPAPQFTVTDLNGAVVDSRNFQGRVMLVDFWATWCVPCEAEIPHLVEWQKQHGADGLQVIGISMDDTSGPVKSYVRKHEMEYPVAMADEKTIAAFGGVLGLPANILIGRDGRIIAKHVGVTDIAVLQKEVEQALSAK